MNTCTETVCNTYLNAPTGNFRVLRFTNCRLHTLVTLFSVKKGIKGPVTAQLTLQLEGLFMFHVYGVSFVPLAGGDLAALAG